jgi:hypothetical protein
VLAALREVHDGRWERNLGTDGGRTLTWTGRIVVVGATTTAWDRAQDVIASMGDRFVILRVDSRIGREAAYQNAIRNTGREVEMREALSTAVAAVLGRVNPRLPYELTPGDMTRIGRAADVVTRCRTGVDFDYRGNVVDAHAPEMPTRFAKQLVQVMRGAIAVGLKRSPALRLAIRCARDSMPPLRLAILDDVAKHPHSETQEIRRRLNKPRNTIDRQLQALYMLGVLSCAEVPDGNRGSKWFYDVAEGIEPAAINVPDLSPPIPGTQKSKKAEGAVATDMSGMSALGLA